MIDYPTLTMPSPAAALAHKVGAKAKRTSPFRTRLREHREVLGLRLKDVAKEVGVGVSHLERGGGINLTLAFKLAAFYGRKVNDIWEVR